MPDWTNKEIKPATTIGRNMARGWESKSVEEMREVDIASAESVRHAMTLKDLERARQLETLHLARSQSLDQLKAARTAGHRALLERTLTALDEQVRVLEGALKVERVVRQEVGDGSDERAD
jgi:hypothetical protein